MTDDRTATANAPVRQPMAGFTALPMGTRLDPFVIDSVIGAGGFGITYLAHHETLKKPYALKEYFPREFAYREGLTVRSAMTAEKTFTWGLSRFLDEARALAKFKHPAIVDVAHVFEANGTAYMALAYEQGRTFASWLRDLGRRPTQAELDRLVGPLLDALEVMHAAGMLHRDIAPDNILVRDDGTPVLLDFGSARSDMKERAGPVTAIVKTGYSPQEQYRSVAEQQGPWSDIYAFAATLYLATTGRPPMDAMDRATAAGGMSKASTATGDYRRGFLEAIDWGMRMEHGERPQSIADWRVRLFDPTEPTILMDQPGPSATGDGRAAAAGYDGLPIPPRPTPSPGFSLAAKAGLGLAILAGGGMLVVAATRPPVVQMAAKPPLVPPQTVTGGPAAVPAGASPANPSPPASSGGPATINPAPVSSSQVAVQASPPGAAPAPTLAPERPLEISVALPKTSYGIGDPFTFTLRASRDCNFLVYTIDAADKVELHDPAVSGAFLGPAQLKAGEIRQIPIPGAPGRAVIKAPTGHYELGAVCAREDLAKLGISETQLKLPAAGGKRSFTFKLEEAVQRVRRDELSRVTVGYEVK